MNTRHLLVLIGMAALCSAISSPLAAQAVSVPAFDSVVLRNGGKVVINYGAAQQVTLLKGSRDYTNIEVEQGALVINRCSNKCPRGYQLEIEIATPQISAVAVRDGGTVETRGNFPPRSDFAVAVDHGGTIDVRSIEANGITAAVNSGGRIFTKPRASITASITSGGIITYWGDPSVASSVRDGGAVTKGAAADFEKPISNTGHELPPIPPLPPVPPIRSVLNNM